MSKKILPELLLFKNQLLLEDKRFYTYIYLDPRKPGNYQYGKYSFKYEPFYVGKGYTYRTYNRSKSHWKEIKKKKISNTPLQEKLLELLNNNYKPIINLIFNNISDRESGLKEIEIIKVIGRMDKKIGPLLNRSNGGEGCMNYGWDPIMRKRQSINLSGENNPNYGKHETHPVFGKKIYNNGKNEGRFFENEQPEGYNLGKLPCSYETRRKISICRRGKCLGEEHPNFNRKIYNNGQIEKFFIEGNEDDEFILGRLPYSEEKLMNMSISQKESKNSNRGKRKYSNGNSEAFFFEGEQPEGWKLGRLQETRDNMSKSLKGRDSHNKNKKCYTNGQKVEYFKENTQPEGWYLGISDYTMEKYKRRNPTFSTKNKKWYNNGISQKFYYPGNQPEGWIEGRIYSKRNTKKNNDPTKT